MAISVLSNPKDLKPSFKYTETKLKNKLWRMNNLYHIRSKDTAITLFRPNEIQTELLEYRRRSDYKNVRDVILKARQLGISTFSILYTFDDVLFQDNFNAGIVAHKHEAVQSLFRIIRIAWKYFPEELKNRWKLDTCSKTEYAFSSNSRIKVALSFRADTLDALHISELAKITKQYPRRAEEIITGSIPAVTPTGSITIESTAEGGYGYFYDYYTEARERGYKSWFFPWFTDKSYVLKVSDQFRVSNLKKLYNINFEYLQEKYNLTNEQIFFYAQKTRELKRLVLQELPSCSEDAFVQSGNPVFDMTQALKCDPSEPRPEFSYVAGLDPAGFMGLDYHAFTIIEYPSGKQVYALREKQEIDLFAKKIVDISKKYNNALLNIERNGVGLAMVNEVKKHYQNLYTSYKSYDKFTGRKEKMIGTSIGSHNKTLFISLLESAIRNKDILISDTQTWNELSVYQAKETGGFTAPLGTHDDMVMSLVLAKLAFDDIQQTTRPAKAERKSYAYNKNTIFEELNI